GGHCQAPSWEGPHAITLSSQHVFQQFQICRLIIHYHDVSFVLALGNHHDSIRNQFPGRRTLALIQALEDNRVLGHRHASSNRSARASYSYWSASSCSEC